MPSDNDNISRSAAKEAIADKLRFHGESLEKLKSRHSVHPSHISHCEGLVNGLEVALAALDSLPAAEADGRWEKLQSLAGRLFVWGKAAIASDSGAANAYLHAGEELAAALAAPSPPAAEGAEREVNAAFNKPFHKAECECEICLEWHRDNPPVTIRRDGYFTCPKCTSPYFSRNPDTGMTKCNGSSSGPIVFGDSRGMCDWLGVWPPDFTPDNDISNSGPAAQPPC